MLRSKLEHDKSKKTKCWSKDVSQRDVTAEEEMPCASSAAVLDYIPPWFHRYVEYKFNLLDRTGTSTTGIVHPWIAKVTERFDSFLPRDTLYT